MENTKSSDGLCENEERSNNSKLEEAVEKVKSNQLSVRKAAQTYGIKKSTLSRHVKNKPAKRLRGRPLTVFTKSEEEKIVQVVKLRCSLGLGCTIPQVATLIEESLNELQAANPNRIPPFENNRPSYKWTWAWARRQNLVLRTGSELTSAREKVSEADLALWKTDLDCFMSENQELFSDPRRIFNYDEHSFNLGAIQMKTLSEKGNTSRIQHSMGGSREHGTLALAVNAQGQAVKPRIVLKGAYNLESKYIRTAKQEGWRPGILAGEPSITFNEKGFVESQTFIQILNDIKTHCDQQNITMPIANAFFKGK